MMRSRNQGMAVVIVILLGAIAVPALLKARAGAREVGCLSTLVAIAEGLPGPHARCGAGTEDYAVRSGAEGDVLACPNVSESHLAAWPRFLRAAATGSWRFAIGPTATAAPAPVDFRITKAGKGFGFLLSIGWLLVPIAFYTPFLGLEKKGCLVAGVGIFLAGVWLLGWLAAARTIAIPRGSHEVVIERRYPLGVWTSETRLVRVRAIAPIGGPAARAVYAFSAAGATELFDLGDDGADVTAAMAAALETP
jgi:hypothetical protein